MKLDQAVLDRPAFLASLKGETNADLLVVYNDIVYEIAMKSAVPGETVNVNKRMAKFDNKERAVASVTDVFDGLCQILDRDKPETKDEPLTPRDEPATASASHVWQTCPNCGHVLEGVRPRTARSARQSNGSGAVRSTGLRAAVGEKLLFPSELALKKGNLYRPGTKKWNVLKCLLENPGLTYAEFVALNDKDPRYGVAHVKASCFPYLRKMLGERNLAVLRPATAAELVASEKTPPVPAPEEELDVDIGDDADENFGDDDDDDDAGDDDAGVPMPDDAPINPAAE